MTCARASPGPRARPQALRRPGPRRGQSPSASAAVASGPRPARAPERRFVIAQPRPLLSERRASSAACGGLAEFATHDPNGEPLPLVVADESAPWLVASGRWRFWGGRPGRVAGGVAGGPCRGAECAREGCTGSPRRDWGVWAVRVLSANGERVRSLINRRRLGGAWSGTASCIPQGASSGPGRVVKFSVYAERR